MRQRRPDTDPAALVPTNWADARRMIEEYVNAGLTKFVVRPAAVSAAPNAFDEFLEHFVADLMPLQN